MNKLEKNLTRICIVAALAGGYSFASCKNKVDERVSKETVQQLVDIAKKGNEHAYSVSGTSKTDSGILYRLSTANDYLMFAQVSKHGDIAVLCGDTDLDGRVDKVLMITKTGSYKFDIKQTNPVNMAAGKRFYEDTTKVFLDEKADK